MTIHDAPRLPQDTPAKQARTITILYVEDQPTATASVKEGLQAKGWKVETCTAGVGALKLLESTIYYDVLLLDNELPAVNGLQLIRHARQLPHRRRMPVIMLSVHDCEREAWSAGADAFLRKPQERGAVAETIECLLARQTR